MQTFLLQLQMRMTLESVLWLHDGVWIPSDVSSHDIRYAERAMLRTLCLKEEDESFFRVRQLDELAALAKHELGLAPRCITLCLMPGMPTQPGAITIWSSGRALLTPNGGSECQLF